MIEAIYDEAETERARFGFAFEHPALSNPVVIPFNTRETNTAKTIMRCLLRQTQSAGQEVFDEATLYDPPSGRGRGLSVRAKLHAPDAIVRDPKTPGLKLIENTDNYCLVRVAMAYADMHQHAKNRKRTPGNKEEQARSRAFYMTMHKRMERVTKDKANQKKKAMELLLEAGIPQNLTYYGIPELERLQQTPSLADYRVFLLDPKKMDASQNFKPILWKSPNKMNG